MNNIGVCVNLNKDADFFVTKNIISIAEKLGASCEIVKEGKDYDFIISLGGDGTFLATSRRFFNNKIVGVNLGNLGFLSEIDKNNIEVGLKNILEGKFTLEKRFLLESSINGKEIIALNDIVINKGSLTKMLNLDVYFDNRFVDNYVADGFIVSTPTGSTAYSLSAGGPIVDPKVDVLIMNPICPHSLHQRPIIISADTEVKIVSKVGEFLISADGQEPIKSENLDSVIIKRSKKNIEIIRVTENSFFDIVREKFHLN